MHNRLTKAQGRLLALARKLMSVGPNGGLSRFNWGIWSNKEGKQEGAVRDCGTRACVAGWAAIMWPNDWRWGPTLGEHSPPILTARDGYTHRAGSTAFARFFGISHKKAGEICEPVDSFCMAINRQLSNNSPLVAVAMIFEAVEGQVGTGHPHLTRAAEIYLDRYGRDWREVWEEIDWDREDEDDDYDYDYDEDDDYMDDEVDYDEDDDFD